VILLNLNNAPIVEIYTSILFQLLQKGPMARKQYKPEEIVQHLRTVEIEKSKGATQEDSARKILFKIFRTF